MLTSSPLKWKVDVRISLRPYISQILVPRGEKNYLRLILANIGQLLSHSKGCRTSIETRRDAQIHTQNWSRQESLRLSPAVEPHGCCCRRAWVVMSTPAIVVFPCSLLQAAPSQRHQSHPWCSAFVAMGECTRWWLQFLASGLCASVKGGWKHEPWSSSYSRTLLCLWPTHRREEFSGNSVRCWTAKEKGRLNAGSREEYFATYFVTASHRSGAIQNALSAFLPFSSH